MRQHSFSKKPSSVRQTVSLMMMALFCMSNAALAVGIKVPALLAPVHDQAGLFNPEQKSNLNALLTRIDQQTDVQIAILTVDSLLGESIEQTSIRVVDQWQLGQANTDKGLLLLIAKQDREVRIEVGQGLEGNIPDAYSKRIIDQQLLPNFKQGRFYDGVMQALYQLAQLSLSSDQLNQVFEGESIQTEDEVNNWFILFLVLAIVLLNRFFSKSGYGYAYYGRGGFGSGGRGGGFSGGGGGFSGGGSSGSW